MTVEYDERVLNDDVIIKAVTNAGYGANVHTEVKENRQNEEKVDKTKESINSMKKRLWISIAFLIPLMYVAMNHMLYEGLKIPAPQFIKDLFHGAENGVTSGLTQLLLLLPIIYANRNYFIVRFQKII